MLWVWGEGPKAAAGSSSSSGAAAGEEDPVSRMFRKAEETEPIYAPGISVDDPDVPSDAPPLGGGKPEKLLTLAGRYCRDVEYDATTLIDNLMDASHLAFAHTGVLGDRSSEDAGDVAAARVSLLEGAEGTGEEEEEAETAALAAVLASTPHKREKSEGKKGPHLDRHSAAARALRTELLSGDAAVFDSAFRVPRTDMEGGRMLTRMIFEPPALATWFCDKPDGDPVCAGSRWRVRKLLRGGGVGGARARKHFFFFAHPPSFSFFLFFLPKQKLVDADLRDPHDRRTLPNPFSDPLP